MAVMGLLHSSGLPVMTAHVAILSLGSPARRPRAMASKMARYWASEYLLGSLPTSADVTSGLLLEGPKAWAKCSPFARMADSANMHNVRRYEAADRCWRREQFIIGPHVRSREILDQLGSCTL